MALAAVNKINSEETNISRFTGNLREGNRTKTGRLKALHPFLFRTAAKIVALVTRPRQGGVSDFQLTTLRLFRNELTEGSASESDSEAVLLDNLRRLVGHILFTAVTIGDVPAGAGAILFTPNSC